MTNVKSQCKCQSNKSFKIPQDQLLWHLHFDLTFVIWLLTVVFYLLWFVICQWLFDIWHLILDTWHCTFPIPHLIFYIDIWHPELWSWSWSLTELATLILLIDTITISIVTWSSTEPTFTVLGGTGSTDIDTNDIGMLVKIFIIHILHVQLKFCWYFDILTFDILILTLWQIWHWYWRYWQH